MIKNLLTSAFQTSNSNKKSIKNTQFDSSKLAKCITTPAYAFDTCQLTTPHHAVNHDVACTTPMSRAS